MSNPSPREIEAVASLLCDTLTDCTISVHGAEILIQAVTPSQARSLHSQIEKLAAIRALDAEREKDRE